MARVVTADHIIFKECIGVFRSPEPMTFVPLARRQVKVGYILLDFELTQALDFKHFLIQPTQSVQFPKAYTAFVAPVVLPPGLEHHNAHLFTTALSAVLSFAIGRPVRSPRNTYTSTHSVNKQDFLALGIHFPVLCAGPGSHNCQLSQETIGEFYYTINRVTSVLFSLPYELYFQVMYAIRLVHLAHLSKREDFALAYYLLVSAIESMAQLAIERKDVVEPHPCEQKWEQLAKSCEYAKELLDAYKVKVGESSYLRRRFVKFVFQYCPHSTWGELAHPMENLVSYSTEAEEVPDVSWLTEKNLHEVYPSDLSEKDIRAILSDTYTYRSKFTHKGKSPPHQQPNSHNRYFDLVLVWDKNKVKRIVVPNFQFIAFIAQRSILEFISKLDDILLVLTRKPIPPSQIILYKALYEAYKADKTGIGWVTKTRLASKIRVDDKALSGILGALGNRVNHTTELGAQKPGIDLLVERDLANGELRYRMRPELRIIIEILPDLRKTLNWSVDWIYEKCGQEEGWLSVDPT